MTPPRISLVTPNFNYGHFLAATIDSVLAQGYPALEYVVVDDASTDASREVIDRYAGRLVADPNPANLGQYRTLTRGLNRTTGEVMGWLNSDDLHLPWTLRAVAGVFAAFPQVEWLTTLRPGYWDFDGLSLGFGTVPGFSRAAFLDGRTVGGSGYIQQESTFWRRSLWDRAGGYVSHEYGSAGDFDLWARFFESAEPVGVTIPLAGFRYQHAQQTAALERYNGHCRRALADARRRAGGGRPGLARRAARAARLPSLPGVRDLAAAAVGYHGRRVVRAEVAGPAPRWVLEPYRFL